MRQNLTYSAGNVGYSKMSYYATSYNAVIADRSFHLESSSSSSSTGSGLRSSSLLRADFRSKGLLVPHVSVTRYPSVLPSCSDPCVRLPELYKCHRAVKQAFLDDLGQKRVTLSLVEHLAALHLLPLSKHWQQMLYGRQYHQKTYLSHLLRDEQG